jgi:hypothetical protein
MAVLTPSVALKQALAQTWLDQFSVGDGNVTLLLYTGTKPTSPSVAATGTLLGTGTAASPVGSIATDGETVKLVFDAIAPDASADASGIASWLRFIDENGDPILDADVTSTAGTGSFKMNTTNVVEGGPIAFTSCVITF